MFLTQSDFLIAWEHWSPLALFPMPRGLALLCHRREGRGGDSNQKQPDRTEAERMPGGESAWPCRVPSVCGNRCPHRERLPKGSGSRPLGCANQGWCQRGQLAWEDLRVLPYKLFHCCLLQQAGFL